MADQIHLVDIVGYRFYQLSFTIVVCFIPIIFYKYFFATLVLVATCAILAKVWDFFMVTEVDIKGRSVFITGCDSGLGFAFARHLCEYGFTVFAGCLEEKGQGARKLKDINSQRIHIVPLDVTKEQSVSQAFQYVQKNLSKKGLWGVVNNAGMNMTGEVELIPVSIYQKGFNVNLYGAIRVTKQFLPLIRQYQGRVINITSVHGRLRTNQMSNYEVAKQGLETVSDSLRMEMRKFGVHVAIVEPGRFGFSTSVLSDFALKRMAQDVDEMWERASEEIQRDYTKVYLNSWVLKPLGIGWSSGGEEVTPVVKAVAHALCSGRPLTRYLVDGKGCPITFIDEYANLARFGNILPTWLIDMYTSYWRKTDRFN